MKSKLLSLNAPPPSEGNWVWLTRRMLLSQAWCAMPSYAMRVVFRIAIEHLSQGGTQNGELVVTYSDFENYGIRRARIFAGIAIAEALGFIDTTRRGRRVYGASKVPSTYALTWLPRCDRSPATHRWKGVTAEQARSAVGHVRAQCADRKRPRRSAAA